MAGRLRNFSNQWENITSDPYILKIVRGYRIPFVAKVKQKGPPKERLLSHKEIKIFSQAITELRAKGAISRCQPVKGQFISSYFLIDKSNGDKRFILNLKKLNKFLSPPHFKLENLKTAQALIWKNCFMTSIDLKDSYFLIPISKSHRKYLRFFFQGILYEFNCLPFGLSVAPYVFTKLLKPVMHLIRSKGIRSVNYLDDFLILSENFQKSGENTSYVVNLLQSLGLVVNFSKCQLDPNQTCKFLGFILDSKEMCVRLPDKKRENILSLVNKFLKIDQCKIQDLAQFLGVLVAACPGIQYGWLYTKRMERLKFIALREQDNNYEAKVVLSQEVIEDLNWWAKIIKISNNPIVEESFDLIICSDSSKSGWGMWCETTNQTARGWWTEEEKQFSINYLELKAAFYALKIVAKNRMSCHFLLRLDNTTAMSYIRRMGSVQFPHLSDLCRELWQWCEDRDIWLTTTYINTKDNVIADAESRKLAPETEWELANWAFQEIEQKFGIFDIDLFASTANTKCSRFFSWRADPNAEATDAFTMSWSNLFFYAFPPFAIVLRVLQKIITDRAEGIVIVPNWPTQPWFPVFTKLLQSDLITFQPNDSLLIGPFREKHPLARSLTLVAGRLSGRHY